MLSDLLTPLFAPAHRPELFAKAAAAAPDAIILDLEDAVAPSGKDAARANLRTDLAVPVIVRINGIGTPWHAADVERVRRLRPAAVMIPKAEMSRALERLCAEQFADLPVIALVETARGLADARGLAGMPAVQLLAFGSWDYCADLGCDHSDEALLPARSELVLASRLGGKRAPIDGVTTSIGDAALIEAQARRAHSLGLGGKLVIHPRQLAPARAGFAPSARELRWAESVLASGDGAVAVDGAMVDEPVRQRARAIRQRAQRAGMGA
jgi:citrate lyase subunit beta/citryl-CoA lyase